jgi:integrase
MPAEQRGQPYRLKSGRGWGLRYYNREGEREYTEQKFPSRSAAFAHYRDVIAPQLRGDVLPVELTLAELADLYLERHATGVSARTIVTLRERLAHATKAYGNVPLRELERMSGELADWQATLPERSRYGIVQALRQTLGAAVRWGYMRCNPAKLAGKNPEPAPRAVRVYTLDELDAITAKLDARYRPVPAFASATGLRPEEWAPLERSAIDRRAGVVNVHRFISDGVVVSTGKTPNSRRQVPLSPRALAALDQLSARLDTRLLFPAPGGGLLNLDNWRRRVWRPAIVASGVSEPARIYDLRATYASNQLAAEVSEFELARLMGTSGRMIEKHYGTLVQGAMAGIAQRQAAFEVAQERARDEAGSEES